VALHRGLTEYGVFVPENWLPVAGGNFIICRPAVFMYYYCDQINKDEVDGR
jgi:hypothetical protein